MSWIGWTLLVLVGLVGIGSQASKKTKKKSEPGSSRLDIQKEAEETASKITNVEEYRALEQKLEKTFDSEPQSDRGLQNLWRKRSVLQAALRLAKAKVGRWQFVPPLNLETPGYILDHAYKLYTTEEVEQLKESFAQYPHVSWSGTISSGGPIEPPSALESLKRFRSIIETDMPVEETERKINELVASNPKDFEPYFKKQGEVKPGEEWFGNKLVQQGLPLAYELYREGYTTPEKCLEIDPNEFLKRKGVGPKTVEKLKQFQQNTKEALAGKQEAS